MSLLGQIQSRYHRLKIPFMRIATVADRRFRRYKCYIMCTMSFADRAAVLDGVVDSISRGGIQFRPAKTYILDRRGEKVTIGIGHYQFYGKIVAVRPTGYGVALNEELDEQELLELLQEYE